MNFLIDHSYFKLAGHEVSFYRVKAESRHESSHVNSLRNFFESPEAPR